MYVTVNTHTPRHVCTHHVLTGKIKKMKVSVAAQVLSGRMSAMHKYTAQFSK